MLVRKTEQGMSERLKFGALLLVVFELKAAHVLIDLLFKLERNAARKCSALAMEANVDLSTQVSAPVAGYRCVETVRVNTIGRTVVQCGVVYTGVDPAVEIHIGISAKYFPLVELILR